MFLHVARWVILIAAAMPLIYYVLAIVAARRFFRGHAPPPRDFAPPVSILKPVRGLDRESYENFASFCSLDYPEYEILFNVADERDPAIPVIEKIIRDFPLAGVRLLIGAERIGASNKVNKLSRMVGEARNDILVISDADIRVSRDYLRAVVAPFRDPMVGAVTCCIAGFRADRSARSSRQSGIQLILLLACLSRGSSTPWILRWARRWLRRKRGSPRSAASRNRRPFHRRSRVRAPDCGEGLPRCDRFGSGGYGVSGHFGEGIFPAPTAMVRCDSQRHTVRPSGLSSRTAWHGRCSWRRLRRGSVRGRIRIAYVVLCGVMAWTVGVWGLRDPLLRKRFWLVPVQDACAFFVLIVSFFTRNVHWRGSNTRSAAKNYSDQPPARG